MHKCWLSQQLSHQDSHWTVSRKILLLTLLQERLTSHRFLIDLRVAYWLIKKLKSGLIVGEAKNGDKVKSLLNPSSKERHQQAAVTKLRGHKLKHNHTLTWLIISKQSLRSFNKNPVAPPPIQIQIPRASQLLLIIITISMLWAPSSQVGRINNLWPLLREA